MTDRLAVLRARREELVTRAAVQRAGLKRDIEPLRRPLARVDQALAVIHYVKRHPSLIVGAGVMLVILRRGPAGTWLSRGWLAWRMLQTLRSSLVHSRDPTPPAKP